MYLHSTSKALLCKLLDLENIVSGSEVYCILHFNEKSVKFVRFKKHAMWNIIGIPMRKVMNVYCLSHLLSIVVYDTNGMMVFFLDSVRSYIS